MGKLIEFKPVNKVSRDDRPDKPGKVVELPRRPKAARYEWRVMDFELAQVLGAALDAERISDGSCWVLVRIKDSAAFVFLVDSGDGLFTVVGVDDFQAMRPELEQWAGEVFSWLWLTAANGWGRPYPQNLETVR